MTIHVVRETGEQRIERCDHEGTTGSLNDLTSVSVCTACGATWQRGSARRHRYVPDDA